MNIKVSSVASRRATSLSRDLHFYKTEPESSIPLWPTHQFQHPWATTACGKASKQAKHDDGGASANEHIGSICGVLGNKGDVGAQSKFAPDSNGQQDHPSDLKRAGGRRDGKTAAERHENRHWATWPESADSSFREQADTCWRRPWSTRKGQRPWAKAIIQEDTLIVDN